MDDYHRMDGLLNVINESYASPIIPALLKNDWNSTLNISISSNCPLMETECVNYIDFNCFKSIAVAYGENYHAFVSIAICLFGITLNLIIIFVLKNEQLSLLPINKILKALGINNILIMLEYIAFINIYYIELSTEERIPYLAALFVPYHIYFEHVMHSLSTCLTTMLAIWRYLVIGYPNDVQILCTNRRCVVGIFLCIAISILLSVPICLTFKFGTTVITDYRNYNLYVIKLSEDIMENEYLLLNFWLYAVIIKLLPCCPLILLNIWIIRGLFAAKLRNEQLKNYSYSSNDRRSKRILKLNETTKHTRNMMLAALVLFLLTQCSQGILAFIIGINERCAFSVHYYYFREIRDILELIAESLTCIINCWMNGIFRTLFRNLFVRKANMRVPCIKDLNTTSV